MCMCVCGVVQQLSHSILHCSVCHNLPVLFVSILDSNKNQEIWNR